MDQPPSGTRDPGHVPTPNTLAGGVAQNSLAGPTPPATASPRQAATSADATDATDATEASDAADALPASSAGVAGTGPAEPPRRGRRRWAVIGSIAAGLALIAVKLALGFAVATVASVALNAVFGDTFSRLPRDQQEALQHRIDAAFGDSLNGLSDHDRQARLTSMSVDGQPRLDDPTLVEFAGLWTAAIEATDTRTCAAAARTTSGVMDSKVVEKAISSLTMQQLGRWYEIEVSAVEAAAKAAPVRSLSPADSDAMWAALSQQMSQSDLSTLQKISNGEAVTDDDACRAYRDYYKVAMALDPVDRARFALVDVASSAGQSGAGAAIAPSATPGPDRPTQGSASSPPGAAASSPPSSADRPHDDPDLEAKLPATVNGQTLASESYRGSDLFTGLWGMSDADVAGIRTELAKVGLTIDDVSVAVDGRAVSGDPPYFVNALRFKGIPTHQWPAQLGLDPTSLLLDHRDVGTFSQKTVGGKAVLVGTLAMVDQTTHARGIPYAYSVGDVQFVVITDNPAWAADALRQLP